VTVVVIYIGEERRAPFQIPVVDPTNPLTVER
jgi:hypothetical protein